MPSFEHLKTAVAKRLGLTAYTEMQEAAFASVLSEKDTMLLATTGSGKTLAFLLPLLAQVDTMSEYVQVLVIVPSRELAIQIAQVVAAMKVDVRCVETYGGRAAMDENRRLRSVMPHLVVGTPGRLLDHLRKENLQPYGIRRIVIDEFDKCLELGFHDEMAAIFAYLPHLKQRVLTPATAIEVLPKFVRFADNAHVLSYLEHETKGGNVKQYYLHTPENDKLRPLAQLLTQLGYEKSIVFVNYRESVERVVNYLREYGFVCEGFHGKLEQQERERVFYRFRSGCVTTLVSTDLSARGLDVSDVKHVIHYHLPTSAEAYTHRSGRTGRWETEGNAYLMLNPKERELILDYAIDTEPYYLPDDAPIKPVQPEWTTLYIGRGKKDKLSKGDILGFLCKVGGLNVKHIGMIDVKEHQAYVSVHHKHVKHTLVQLQNEKIKGMKTKIEVMRR